MMKKRGKKFLNQLTIDRLQTSLTLSRGGAGEHRDETEQFIIKGRTESINDHTGLAFLRRRKNFSVILFVGLSALLCALYYTSYYPSSSSVWTLRFGVTPFTKGAGPDGHSKPLPRVMGSAANSREELNHLQKNAGAKRKEKAEKAESAFDGESTSRGHNNHVGGGRSKRRKISTSISNISDGEDDEVRGEGYKDEPSSPNNGNGEGEMSGVAGASKEGISTPKEWNWKYWASLNYWKIGNLTDTVGEDNDLSEKRADGVSDFSSRTIIPTISTSSKYGGNGHGGQRLLCNFPRLNPFDPSITDFIKSPPAIDCRKGYPLVFRTNFLNKLIQMAHPFPSSLSSFSSASFSPSLTERKEEVDGIEMDRNEKDGNGVGDFVEGEKEKIMSKNLEKNNYSCCYKTITRGNGSDHNVIFSKRCYPLLKSETEIPPLHEFISVRCRLLRDHVQTYPQKKISQQQDIFFKESTLSMKGTKRFHNKITMLTNDSITNTDNEGNAQSVFNNANNYLSRTKVYKDMFAFVPLKPAVEDRIRKYEESKQKSLYHSKTRQLNIKKVNYDTKTESESELPPNVFERLAYDDDDRLSIIILGLDAQSHMNFIRQMPQTYNFLTKNLSSIGLYGYTKVGDNTFPNVVSLLSGLSVDELTANCWPTKDSYFDICTFIWKNFSESGYRTSLAEDSVWMGTFNYEKKGFLELPTDYYLNQLSLLMSKKIGHETWANAKLCYGPRLAFEVLLDYMVKTAVAFRDGLYFQFIWANSLLHDYLNNPRLGDELLLMTLAFLRNHGYLNKTAFILLSDHGIRWGSIRSTYQGKIEERMPLAYFYFPEWFKRRYSGAVRNLRRNAWRLTTPFDVHETLKDILRLSRGDRLRFNWWSEEGNKSGGDEGESGDKLSPRGISLFRPVPLQRTCKMAGIEEHWCVCHSLQSVPINSTPVQGGARFVVKVINELVSKHRESCAKLELLKINEAKRKIDGNIDRDIDFRLKPGPESESPKTNISKEDDSNKIYVEKTAQVSSEGREIEKDNNRVTSSPASNNDVIKMVQLQIVIVTTPGHAVFEATINGNEVDDRTKNGNVRWKLAGDISRLNLYGEQSACVEDYTIQKYCYCHKFANLE